MPLLLPPTVSVHQSFLMAMAEFAAEGRGVPDDNSMIGDDLRNHGPSWHDPEVFASYVAEVLAEVKTPRREGFVNATTLWLIEGEEYLGRIQLRHELNDWLREAGGHIGYDVRATARRRGHASQMLKETLPIARGLGIESVLITCDPDNAGSRKVIENAGGVLEDERQGKLRYWVTTT